MHNQKSIIIEPYKHKLHNKNILTTEECLCYRYSYWPERNNLDIEIIDESDLHVVGGSFSVDLISNGNSFVQILPDDIGVGIDYLTIEAEFQEKGFEVFNRIKDYGKKKEREIESLVFDIQDIIDKYGGRVETSMKDFMELDVYESYLNLRNFQDHVKRTTKERREEIYRNVDDLLEICTLFNVRYEGNRQWYIRTPYYLDENGYVCLLFFVDHGSRRYSLQSFKEHRLIALKHLGLKHYWDKHLVHHKDMNKLNNSPNNLMLVTEEEHAEIHKDLKWAKEKINA